MCCHFRRESLYFQGIPSRRFKGKGLRARDLCGNGSATSHMTVRTERGPHGQGHGDKLLTTSKWQIKEHVNVFSLIHILAIFL